MVGVDGSSPFAPTKIGSKNKHLAETPSAFFLSVRNKYGKQPFLGTSIQCSSRTADRASGCPCAFGDRNHHRWLSQRLLASADEPRITSQQWWRSACGGVVGRARDVAAAGYLPGGDGVRWCPGCAGRIPAPCEIAIAFSGVVLGIIVAFAIRPPLWVASVLVRFFAIFHGHAHGSGLPAAANAVTYAVGFVLATGLLHLAEKLSACSGAGPWDGWRCAYAEAWSPRRALHFFSVGRERGFSRTVPG
jgi:hypothetical protein